MTLKDDIDIPLVKTIALLNLLDIRTIWCCCGFNYEGQPEHKLHDYGTLQILVENNQKAIWLATGMLQSQMPFQLTTTLVAPKHTKALGIVRTFGHPVKEWDKPEGPHFHEMPSQYICQLERFLLQPYVIEMMRDEVIVIDTNAVVRETNPYWDYKPRTPWVIKKDEFVMKPKPIMINT